MPYSRPLAKWKHWPLIALIAVSLAAGAMLLWVHFFNYHEMKRREAKVNQGQANIARLLDFSSALQETLLVQRAYLILGTAERYQKVSNGLRNLAAKIPPLAANIEQPTSQIILREIDGQVLQLEALFEHLINNRTPTSRDAFDVNVFGEFFSLIAAIQDNLDQLRIAQNSVLHTQIKEREEMQYRYVMLMLAASLSSLVIVAVMSALMLRLQTKEYTTQRTLQETKERLDLAIQGTSDVIWDLNPVNQTLYLSPRFKELFGYDDSEIPQDMPALEALIHPDDLPKSQSLLTHYLRQEIAKYEQTFRIRHKNGSWRWVLARGIALWNRQGRVYRMVGVHTDITSLKQLEAELREAREKADAENQAKSEFFANISHEIRTPLNSIIGAADLMARLPAASDEHQEYIHTLQVAANSLLFLINDLLDLSKLEMGSIMLERVPFALTDVLEDALALARLRSREKNIALDSAIPADLPKVFLGDPHRLGQIINNLLSNAVKFTHSGGVALTVSGTYQEHSRHRQVEIRVKDTGIGIPQDKQNVIFDKFAQSDSSITRRFGGTGLGLSICRELCELMGGNIGVVSTLGKGSEFIVTLPLDVAPAGMLPANRNAPPPIIRKDQTKGTVLLVEDYKPNIVIARTVLNDLGYSCEVATSGQEALSALCNPRRRPFIAVLMDIELPAMSGLEITERVRNYETAQGFRHIPIIAMTAYALVGDRDRCLNAGMDDYISKPFNIDELDQKLSQLTTARAEEDYLLQAESA